MASDKALVRVKLSCSGEEEFASLLESEFDCRADNRPDCKVLQKSVCQLREYFEGRRREFDISLKLDAGEFTRKALGQVAQIPYGKTVTYGDIARRVGNPRAYRAVGGAVGANPLPLIIPCHRVVAANGLGGFGAGLELKKKLLELEGAL